ncbi:MAG: iron-sulfur cluster assembly scaffold protein [Thermoleophilia bacterium]|nr:iron-sulfur cluster assembly scaffold protein [Thermoleophilia bacterium]
MDNHDLLLEHFLNPRNVGEIPDADGVGAVGDPTCGDYFKVWIKVENGRLVQVKFKVRGCPAAIAACSMMTELATGLSVDEAYELDDLAIMHALGGMPETKQHCSNHAAAALREAIIDYVFRRTKPTDTEPTTDGRGAPMSPMAGEPQ